MWDMPSCVRRASLPWGLELSTMKWTECCLFNLLAESRSLQEVLMIIDFFNVLSISYKY